jgi:hypothetical protein
VGAVRKTYKQGRCFVRVRSCDAFTSSTRVTDSQLACSLDDRYLRLFFFWTNTSISKREPSVKIVCRNFSEKPQHGLHQWDCPNLLWELLRMRRVKLTAQQLFSRNLSEAIVQKDNHATDACKHLVMSHPEPTIKTIQEKAADAVGPS